LAPGFFKNGKIGCCGGLWLWRLEFLPTLMPMMNQAKQLLYACFWVAYPYGVLFFSVPLMRGFCTKRVCLFLCMLLVLWF
jgi:hypothetical protein